MTFPEKDFVFLVRQAKPNTQHIWENNMLLLFFFFETLTPILMVKQLLYLFLSLGTKYKCARGGADASCDQLFFNLLCFEVE